MPIFLRQSTASQEVPLGYFVDKTDGDTEETGLTIANTDIKIWVTGATTLANKNSGGGTHISNGIYYAVLDATDTATIGPLIIFSHVSGALAIRVECCVLDETVYDVLFGTTALATVSNITAATGVDVTKWLGTTVSTPTVAGVPNVNTKTWNDLATVALPLIPTTPGRALDVSAGGEAGVDWANVGTPGSTVSLSATTLNLVTTTTTATTATNLTNLPTIPANWLTATGIAAGAFTSAKFAANALDAVWSTAARILTAATNITSTGGTIPILASGLVSSDVTAISTDATAADNAEAFFDGTGYAGTNNTIPTVSSVTALAANSVNASALAADAVNEIWAKACTEPTAVVGAAPTAIAALSWLNTLSRNKITQTATTQTLLADDGATTIATSTISDDATTFTRGEFA